MGQTKRETMKKLHLMNTKHLVEHEGKRITIKELSSDTGIKYHTLYDRIIRKKMSINNAINFISVSKKTTHPLYSMYNMIIKRCYDSRNSSYVNYGAKGIAVCEKWQKPYGFTVFLVDMGERPQGYQIDRIDNTKDYSPENCRWVTQQQNLMNRRKTKRNKSGYKGVSPRPAGKFRAMISKDNKDYVIGNTFLTAKEAARAYDSKAIELFGEFAVLNFPKSSS